MRLVGMDHFTLDDRTLFALAATLMRQTLVDHARRERANKRGGDVTMMSLDAVSPVSQTSIVDVLALGQALDALSSRAARQCCVVELRLFSGLGIDEAAEALGMSAAPVEPEWAIAKAWLDQRLSTVDASVNASTSGS